jgi:hypothetical protein
MRRLALLIPALLLSCGPGPTSVSVTVDGVAMADLERLQSELRGVPGVRDVQPGALKDGRATIAVSFDGNGAALAAKLAGTASLRGVTGFDERSVAVKMGREEPPKTPAAPPVAPGQPAAKPEEALPPKDPLAYKVHALPVGSIALFEGWRITPVPSNDAEVFLTHPEGGENDFQMVVALATPGAQELANLFDEGPKMLLQMIPAARRQGEPKDSTFGGDPARTEDYEAEHQGKSLRIRLVMVKKKDVAVAVLAVGLPEAFKTYGRGVEIMAQGVTIKDSPADPELTGTWTRNHSYTSGTFSFVSQRSLTFYPNGTFSESTFAGGGGDSASAVSKGADRGRVVRRANILTFHYDDGKTTSNEYRIVDGRALKMGGDTYFKQ